MTFVSSEVPTRRGRIAAVWVAINALAFAAYSLGLWLVNFGIVILTASDKKPERPDYVETDEWAAEYMPFVPPWWLFLLFPLVQALLLAMVWHPKDHHPPRYSRGLVIFASPFAIGSLACFGAAYTYRVGADYRGYGSLWPWLIPVAANLGLAAVAYLLTWRNEAWSSRGRVKGKGKGEGKGEGKGKGETRKMVASRVPGPADSLSRTRDQSPKRNPSLPRTGGKK